MALILNILLRVHILFVLMASDKQPFLSNRNEISCVASFPRASLSSVAKQLAALIYTHAAQVALNAFSPSTKISTQTHMHGNIIRGKTG